MCKNFFKGLLGAGSAESNRVAAPATPTVTQSDTSGDVMGTEVVDALSMGRESSGRVALGTAPKKKQGAAVGLSL